MKIRHEHFREPIDFEHASKFCLRDQCEDTGALESIKERAIQNSAAIGRLLEVVAKKLNLSIEEIRTVLCESSWDGEEITEVLP